MKILLIEYNEISEKSETALWSPVELLPVRLPIRSIRAYGFLRIYTNFTYKMRMRRYAILENVHVAYIFFHFFAFGVWADADYYYPLFSVLVTHYPQPWFDSALTSPSVGLVRETQRDRVT